MKKLLFFLSLLSCWSVAAHAFATSGEKRRPEAVAAPDEYDDDTESEEEESCFSADEHIFLEVGYSSGRADAYGNAGRWQLFGTYDFPLRPAWLIGAGGGVLYYPHMKKGFMPVYADFRFNFTPRSRRTPFIDVKFGYAFLLRERDDDDDYYDDDFRFDGMGGIFFSPSIGAQVLRFNGIALSLSAGYSFHKIDFRDPDDRYVERVGGFHFTAALEF